MEYINKQLSECAVCYEQTYNFICPMCDFQCCATCIIDYNKINETKTCKCPQCKAKFSKLLSYLIFKNEASYFLQRQLLKYRTIIITNAQCKNYFDIKNNYDLQYFINFMQQSNNYLLLSFYLKYILIENAEQFDPITHLKLLQTRIFTPSVYKTYYNSIKPRYPNIKIRDYMKDSKMQKVIQFANKNILKMKPNITNSETSKNISPDTLYLISRKPAKFTYEEIDENRPNQKIIHEIIEEPFYSSQTIQKKINFAKLVEINDKCYVIHIFYHTEDYEVNQVFIEPTFETINNENVKISLYDSITDKYVYNNINKFKFNEFYQSHTKYSYIYKYQFPKNNKFNQFMFVLKPCKDTIPLSLRDGMKVKELVAFTKQ